MFFVLLSDKFRVLTRQYTFSRYSETGMIRNPLDMMENLLQLIGMCDEYEEVTDKMFVYISKLLPLRSMGLGFFDRPNMRAFLLSRTNRDGTKKMFYYEKIAPDKVRLGDKIGFFHEAKDRLVMTVDDPVALVHDLRDITPPFLTMRSLNPDLQRGAGNFELQPGVPLPDDFWDIIRAVRMPLNIFVSEQFRHWELQEANKRIIDENVRLKRQSLGLKFTEIIGTRGGLKETFEKIKHVAVLPVSILLTGETGTGKELFAHALHELSDRSEGPFVAVNCGAIPSSLIDNELFGHEKGAYTGANATYKGRFERANNGTIFLDEIGELSLDVQARLLRVLETKTLERLGGDKTISIDYRVVAATHRDLRQMVDDGLFRADLYYRLAAVTIRIPPLRERIQDIPVLVRHFAEQAAARFQIPKPEISPADYARLSRNEWPGNVRELQHAIEEAVAISQDGSFTVKLDNRDTHPSQSRFDSSAQIVSDNFMSWDEMSKRYLQSALQLCGGKIQGKSSAAELLNINGSTLRTKLVKYGLL